METLTIQSNMDYCEPKLTAETVYNWLGQENMNDLEEIQNIIFLQENKALQISEVLGRVLRHYNKSVHYKPQ